MKLDVARANDTDGLDVRLDEGLLRVTLARPERKNALSGAMVDAMLGLLRGAPLDDRVRAVLLTGRETFCSGMEIGGAQASGGGGTQDRRRPRPGTMVRSLRAGAHELIRTMYELELPVVAGVRGSAAGLGLGLALSADYVVTARDANFWAPFVARGFSADSATTFLLPRLVGLRRAKQMLLFGHAIDGETAADWGLVNEAVDDTDLDDAVEEAAASATTGATIAIAVTKQVLHRNLDATFPAALENEAYGEEVSLRSEDFKEGIQAFVARRSPKFTGR